jgi:hypothetical protein
MTIKISFSDKTVKVAIELNGGVESLITELPQREWVGLTDEEIKSATGHIEPQHGLYWVIAKAIEAKLKEKNT